MATRRVFTLDRRLWRGSYGTCFRRRTKAELTACTRRRSRAFLLATRCTGLSAWGTCLYADFLLAARDALVTTSPPLPACFRDKDFSPASRQVPLFADVRLDTAPDGHLLVISPVDVIFTAVPDAAMATVGEVREVYVVGAMLFTCL